MIRIAILLAGVGLGILCAAVAPVAPELVRSTAASVPGFGWLAPDRGSSEAPRGPDHANESEKGSIKLTAEQIEAAAITVAEVRDGVLRPRLRVPGTITPSADRVARVAVKLLGTVAELRKRLGDDVVAGEVVAVIDSREVADAKSEYLSTRSTHELQQTLFARAKMLWEGKASSENDYLRGRAAAEEARIKMESARQKLFALGLPEAEIATLPDQPAASLRRHELRSPITGRVAERRVDLGALVGREGLESELYVIADLSEVWSDLAVAPADIAKVREGQEITLLAGPTGERAEGRVIFVSPLLDKDTRSARAVAALPNAKVRWHPGIFVTAEIPLALLAAAIVVPKAAVQSIKGEPAVFVRTSDGFEKRSVRAGREDDDSVEIVAGLTAGERIAVGNSFTLKAELGKADADEEH
jgi:cobalt-zinc-cadmium efflux system membrane fusion protein